MGPRRDRIRAIRAHPRGMGRPRVHRRRTGPRRLGARGESRAARDGRRRGARDGVPQRRPRPEAPRSPHRRRQGGRNRVLRRAGAPRGPRGTAGARRRVRRVLVHPPAPVGAEGTRVWANPRVARHLLQRPRRAGFPVRGGRVGARGGVRRAHRRRALLPRGGVDALVARYHVEVSPARTEQSVPPTFSRMHRTAAHVPHRPIHHVAPSTTSPHSPQLSPRLFAHTRQVAAVLDAVHLHVIAAPIAGRRCLRGVRVLGEGARVDFVRRISRRRRPRGG